MLSPSSSTTPAFGFSNRARARSSVDFPHAFAPTMHVILPGRDLDRQIARHLDLVVGERQVLGSQRVMSEFAVIHASASAADLVGTRQQPHEIRGTDDAGDDADGELGRCEQRVGR